MEVNDAFTSGFIKEEVCIEQTHGFKDLAHLDNAYKLNKVFYGLKQALRVWYERSCVFLIEHRFTRCHVNTTIFRKIYLDELILIQIYVDAISFGATNESHCEEFSSLMNMIGDLKFFLGLQINKLRIIFIFIKPSTLENSLNI